MSKIKPNEIDRDQMSVSSATGHNLTIKAVNQMEEYYLLQIAGENHRVCIGKGNGKSDQQQHDRIWKLLAEYLGTPEFISWAADRKLKVEVQRLPALPDSLG